MSAIRSTWCVLVWGLMMLGWTSCTHSHAPVPQPQPTLSVDARDPLHAQPNH